MYKKPAAQGETHVSSRHRPCEAQESGEDAVAVHRALQRGISNGAVQEITGADNKSPVYTMTDQGAEGARQNR